MCRPPCGGFANSILGDLAHNGRICAGNDISILSDPAHQTTLFKAQILFWLIGATDGHGKNFSVFLGPGGRFNLTPLYDVLTAQPSLDAHQVRRKQMRLAMSVGQSRHYKLDEITGRHFVQTAAAASLSKSIAREALAAMAAAAEKALSKIEQALPKGFPEKIQASVETAVIKRLRRL